MNFRFIRTSRFIALILRTLREFAQQNNFTEMIFAAPSLKYSLGNSVAYIARPAFGDIKSHHARGVGVLTVHDFADDSPFIGFCLISFDISTAKIAKIVEHDMDGDIIG